MLKALTTQYTSILGYLDVAGEGVAKGRLRKHDSE